MGLLYIWNRIGIIAHRKHNRQNFTPSFSKISKSLIDKIKSFSKICIFSLFYCVSKNILDQHLQSHNKGQWQELNSRGGWGEGGRGGEGVPVVREIISLTSICALFSLLTPATQSQASIIFDQTSSYVKFMIK